MRTVAPGLAGPKTSNLLQEVELVNTDEVGRLQKIGGGDRSVAEAQVADRLRAGFVAVIDEVSLRVVSRILGQNLDAVLVRSNRSVSTETKEQRAADAGRLDVEARIDGEVRSADVIDDADGEAATRVLVP